MRVYALSGTNTALALITFVLSIIPAVVYLVCILKEAVNA